MSKTKTQTSKPKTRWTTIPTRKKIVKLFNEGKTVKEIVEELGVSKWVCYKAINGQTRTEYRPRRDKGTKRKRTENNSGTLSEAERVATKMKRLTDFNDVDEFLEYQIFEACEHMSNIVMLPDEKLKFAKQVSALQQELHERKMEEHLKRGDAEIIARLIRRYMPEADDAQVILIYKEELEKYNAEKRK